MIRRRTLADRASVAGMQGGAIEHLTRQTAVLVNLLFELRVLQEGCLGLLLPRGGESRLSAAVGL